MPLWCSLIVIPSEARRELANGARVEGSWGVFLHVLHDRAVNIKIPRSPSLAKLARAARNDNLMDGLAARLKPRPFKAVGTQER